MLKNLSYRIKNRLLLAGAVLLLLFSWPLALRRTWESVSLNRQLNLKNKDGGSLSYNPEYLNRKNRLLADLLSRYRVDSAEWKNGLWLKASGAAAGRGITVSYTPEQFKTTADTGSVKVLRQRIAFGGGYRGLVGLLDTLEKVEGAGYVSSVGFEKVRGMNAERENKLYMKVVFGVVRK